MSMQPAALCEIMQPVRLRTGRFWSLYGVWYRHFRVYSRYLAANASYPVLDPLFFFAAFAVGIGGYMPAGGFEGLDYRTFIASSLAITTPMFTACGETTWGTFVRLVFQRTYDAMLGTHLSVDEMFAGELLFCASKGLVFSAVVVLVTLLCGAHPAWWCVLVPLVGAATGYLFGAVGLIVTSYLRTINNFSFFFSGLMTPMFFFSGTFFPVLGRHGPWVDLIAVLVPLTHPVQLSRALYRGQFTWATPLHLAALGVFLVAAHVFALYRMRKRVLM